VEVSGLTGHETILGSYKPPYNDIKAGKLVADGNQNHWLRDLLERHERGIIVCGPNVPIESVGTVPWLSAQTGYPYFADSLSNVRYGYFYDGMSHLPIASYETFLQGALNELNPDIVIRFGDEPVSKWLNNYLSSIQPTWHIHISEQGSWVDSHHM
jgi:2-succinyl-5-enolpyruvyl-6-hydroxy-3-cyclohexene-1-carboxylate synthase